MIVYAVTCTFDDPDVSEEWIAWLRDGHLAELIAAGALDAEVVRFDRDAASGKVKCQARYHFASRQSFAAYERDHAPRLRAAGLTRFPPERGLAYERSLCEVCARL